ncbi:hypothetical protein LOTGIDRAFT_170770 [Lottia gigantea]|uniref:Uncharacterized protein n=1 Tax=Lottia gigantea TaxID=225164 RepID=V4BFB3_LOTGI|nr:hypothetical protein LOTGIDRAFT_170770 [Lottia gigantea]ESP04527.1 hypothetical protein LOTGIDRAFT_170770 [Lottia gigantea]
MADVEVCEKEVQTSKPPTDRPSIQTAPSAVSDFSYKSSDTMSEGKLDSLFTNSMKILVRRVNDKDGDSRRPSADVPIEHARTGQKCSVAGCTGIVGNHSDLPDVQSHLDNYSAQSGYLDRRSINYARQFDHDSGNNGRRSGQQSRANGKYIDHLKNTERQSKPNHSEYRRFNSASTDHSSLRLDGISKLPRDTTLQDFNLGFLKHGSDRGTSVDSWRPYRPISKPRLALTRSKTTIPCTSSASRQCDACSVRDLQSWFIMNPGNASPRSPNDVISPTRITREKSQVFLLNKQPKLDCIGQNMAEVMLPMTTVPKKGLIKLTYMDEDISDREGTFHKGKERNRRWREPLRPLIKNKRILEGIKESYNILLEKERLESEQVQRLLNQDQPVHLAAL